MLTKIILIENLLGFERSEYVIDYVNKNYLVVVNDQIVKNSRINSNMFGFDNLISKYIVLWNHSYVDNFIIDGHEILLKIFIDNVEAKYYFKNKFPENFDSFLEEFKRMVG